MITNDSRNFSCDAVTLHEEIKDFLKCCSRSLFGEGNEMHLNRLYQTVNKVMCHWVNRTYLRKISRSRYELNHPFDIYHGSILGAKKCVLLYIIARIRGYVYKMFGINSAIIFHLCFIRAESKILLLFQEIYNVNVQQPNFQEMLCYHS